MRYLKILLILLVCTSFKTDKKVVKTALPAMDEEFLTYEMQYWFFKVGEAQLNLYKARFNNKSVLHSVASVQKTGFWGWFGENARHLESYFDPASFRPYKAVYHQPDGIDNTKYSEVIFNQTDKTFKEVSGTWQKVNKNQFDILSAFYALRRSSALKDKMGDTVKVSTLFAGKRYLLQMRCMGKELIESSLGETQTLKYKFIDPKGIFFNPADETLIWITDDQRHIPVKASTDAWLGHYSLILSSITTGKAKAEEKRLAVNK